MGGTKLSYGAKTELDFQAQRNGFASGDDLLRAIGLAIRGQ
jgi:hypothetical protein